MAWIAALCHRLETVASRVVPSRLKRGLKQLHRVYLQARYAFTTGDLRNALRRLGVAAGDVLMVHSSFDRLVGFRGGPGAVIRTLQEAVGPGGTLMMPTISFTGSAVEHAARDPVFDARDTPSMVGLITEAFRRSAGVVRSLHPTHSVAVWGNRAEAIITGHHLTETPCGRPTPYGKLLEYDGKILFAGVPVSSMTFIHFLEEEIEPQLPFPVFAAEKYALRWKDETGAVGVATTRLFSPRLAGHRDFTPLVAELKRRKQWREVQVGCARFTLLRARDVYDAGCALADGGVFCYDQLVYVAPSGRSA